MPDDRRRQRIAALQRGLGGAAARRRRRERFTSSSGPSRMVTQERIAALERRLEEVLEARSVVPQGADPRPAIQVIQRTEVETCGKKKREPTPAEEKVGQVVAWGRAISMVRFALWCTTLSAAAVVWFNQ